MHITNMTNTDQYGSGDNLTVPNIFALWRKWVVGLLFVIAWTSARFFMNIKHNTITATDYKEKMLGKYINIMTLWDVQRN